MRKEEGFAVRVLEVLGESEAYYGWRRGLIVHANQQHKKKRERHLERVCLWRRGPNAPFKKTAAFTGRLVER